MTIQSGLSRQVVPPIAGPTTEPDPSPVSLVALLNIVLRYRHQVLAIALASAVTAMAVPVLRHRTFTSSASFLPQSGRPNTAVAGLASQFGVNLQYGEATQSPEFYADLLKSRGMLHSAVVAVPVDTTDSFARRRSLVDVLGGDEPDVALRQDLAAQKLGEHTNVSVSTRTGVVTLSVRLHDAELAQRTVGELLRLLNQFNLATRRSQASAERIFVERRLGEVRQDLRAAEERLASFYVRNRDYSNSPTLRFAQERLAREVSVQQQLFSTLAQSYEQAKIEEVRDTPVITLMQPPMVPIRPDRRGLASKAILGFLLGGILGILIALTRHSLSRARSSGSAEYEELTALRGDVIEELTHPWRIFTRSGRTRAPK